MTKISNPIKENMVHLGIARLIYLYGGMVVPISFLCIKDLYELYEKGTKNNSMFVCEAYNENVSSSSQNLYFANTNFMGACKENTTMKRYIEFIQITISSDYTDQSIFIGEINRWCNERIGSRYMNLIPGIQIGTKAFDNTPILIETLLSNDVVNFYDNMYGIWIPSEMVLKRRHYEWFSRMSPEQIIDSDFILAKYFVIALAPQDNSMHMKKHRSDPDWVNFWRVPLTNGTLNIYGLKPLFLGNNVPVATNTGNAN
jgi:hypothetical protein